MTIDDQTAPTTSPMALTPPHPQLVAFLEMLAGLDGPPLYEMDLAEAREVSGGFLALVGDGPPVAAVEHHDIPGPGGSNAARLYVPEDALPGLCVYVHGGGWVLGDLDWCDPVCRRLANGSRLRVLSVDYRLAPEHPFPAAIDDVTAAIRWADDELGDGGPLALAGDSAGGNLVAVAARRARDAGEPSVDLQVLVYPVVSPDFETGSYVRHGDAGLPLGRKEMEFFWDAYTTEEQRLHQDADPMRAETLAGLAPALVVVAGYDPLHDEGLAYAARLGAEGVATEVVAFEDMNHGFFNLVNFFERSDEVVDLVADRLATLARAGQPLS
jgi:acetyl esterase